MPRKANGAAIREIRQLSGVSLRDLAARVGVSPGQLSRAETGVNGMSPMVMRKVADALGVPLESISYPVHEPEVAAS